jgi:hypothetical protein
MFDPASFHQKACRLLADCERLKKTATLECRICYRNGIAKRGTISLTNCRVLAREPIASPPFPAEILGQLESLIPREPSVPNSDSEIFVRYSFFLGTVVDTSDGIIQHC